MNCDATGTCEWSTMQSYMYRFNQMNKTKVCLPYWASQNATQYSSCFNTNETDCYGSCKMYNTTDYDGQPCQPPAWTPNCESGSPIWIVDDPIKGCHWTCPAVPMKCASKDRWESGYVASTDSCMNYQDDINGCKMDSHCAYVPVNETRPAPSTFLTKSFCHPVPTAGTNMTESDWNTCLWNDKFDCFNTGG